VLLFFIRNGLYSIVSFLLSVATSGADASEAQPGSMFIYKWLTFGSMYVGYTLAVVNRKCFSFALPAIINTLHLSKDEIGENDVYGLMLYN